MGGFNLKLLGWKGLAWLCSGDRCGGGSLWRDVEALVLLLGLGKAPGGYGTDIGAIAGILLPKVGCLGGKLPFHPQCFPSRSSPVNVGTYLCRRCGDDSL